MIKYSLTRPSDELDRYLREISVENSTLNQSLNNHSAINKSFSAVDDPEADRFIKELKKLSHDITTTAIPKLKENNTNSHNDLTDISESQPDLAYISQLNGSSFRVKVLINRSWSNDMLFPNNQAYAELERSLSHAINKIYENDESFINFHLISYNFHDKNSFYCDFIINFKTIKQHLNPFLKLILTGNIDDVPISIDKLFIYVLDNTHSLNSECSPECLTQNCSSSKCPEVCCRNITNNEKVLIVNNSINPNWNSENATILASSSWPFNSSSIQTEILGVLNDISSNNTKDAHLFDPTAGSTFPSSQATVYPYSFIPNFNTPFNQQDIFKNNLFLNTPISTLFTPNQDSNSFINKQNSVESNKRNYIPSYNINELQKNTKLIDFNQLSRRDGGSYLGKNLQPRIYYPFKYETSAILSPNTVQTRMHIPSERMESTIGSKVKIWYPKI